MKMWKCVALAAWFGVAGQSAAQADGNFLHVSPSLALAEPCQSGCAYTWTLATRLGDALHFAEQRYGKRDLSWTLLGVDFARTAFPQIFYAGHGGERRDIVIQLTESSARDEKRALFQLAHEVIHVLSPIGPDVRSSVLEEGIATFHSLAYVRNAGIEIDPSYISSEPYEDAYWAIVELQQAHPDFQARTGALRERHGRLSGLSSQQIRAAYPSISPILARRLARTF